MRWRDRALTRRCRDWGNSSSLVVIMQLKGQSCIHATEGAVVRADQNRSPTLQRGDMRVEASLAGVTRLP